MSYTLTTMQPPTARRRDHPYLGLDQVEADLLLPIIAPLTSKAIGRKQGHLPRPGQTPLQRACDICRPTVRVYSHRRSVTRITGALRLTNVMAWTSCEPAASIACTKPPGPSTAATAPNKALAGKFLDHLPHLEKLRDTGGYLLRSPRLDG
jgi:hypothetical protein